MDLEEMKNIWQQHERELKQSRLLNEKIVSNMLKEKSTNAMKTMNGIEYLSVGMCAALLIVFLPMADRLEGIALVICYASTLLFIAVSLLFGLYKINFLSKIDLGRPVAETAERIARFRLLIVRERVWSLMFFPAIIICVFAIVTYWSEGVNPFDNISIYLPKLLLGIGVGIPVALIMYQKLYMNSIRQINDSLKELKEFTAAEVK